MPDKIISKPFTKQGRENWDKIFGRLLMEAIKKDLDQQDHDMIYGKPTEIQSIGVIRAMEKTK